MKFILKVLSTLWKNDGLHSAPKSDEAISPLVLNCSYLESFERT